MEITQLLVLILTFIIIPLLYLTTRPKYKLPPGPRPLPIIGNIHMMGKLPHRSMANLAKKYGPIMTMRLGSVPSIVVSTSDAAKLFLKDHDLVFAGRPDLQGIKYLWYEGKALAFAPYGESWRKIRKMITNQFLAVNKVDSFEWLRKAEIKRTIRIFKEAADKGAVADAGKNIIELAENIMFKMIVGKGKEEDERYDLEHYVEQVLKLGGAFNMADYIPLLAPFDLQGLTRKMKKVSKELDAVFEAIIEDHLNGKDFIHKNDFLGTMLEIMKNPTDIVIDRVNIKAIMLDLFGAGIDTIGHTIEWAMAAMVKEPRVMNALKKELDSVVGDSRMVEEKDLPNLPYLDMVIKETLRLYPGAPLFLPHESMEDIVLNGYTIPKKSRIIINFWGIARDPEDWGENADEFYPERFANDDGQKSAFFPFGAGKRLCPGRHLGTVSTKIVLAHLVHCFDWKLPGNQKPEDVDMSENFGIAIPRADKLYLIPSYRLKVACP